MQTTVNEIERKIKHCKRGKIFFIDDFAALGSPEAVKKSLQRLTNSGLLERIAKGIYLYPKKEYEKYGVTFLPKPSLDDIAHAIAKRDKSRIVPTGAHALNLLNLSTQVPVNVVYLTDGTARRIKIGAGRGILFKHTSDMKRLSYRSELLMLIVSALLEYDLKYLTSEEKNIVKNHLTKITKQEFEADIHLVPVKIRKLLMSL
jgi:hypothetical protein